MRKLTRGLPQQDFSYLMAAIDEAAIVAVTDRNGVITYVNDKFCAISQYTRNELIGKTHKIVNSNYHSKEFFEGMWKTISQGEIWEGEIRNRTKSGSIYWVNTTIVPFMDPSGDPEKYIAVRFDISQKKLAEEKLSVYAKKLEVSNQELTEFASIAAHDLQEPLRKIQSFADRVRVKSADSIPGDAKMYLDKVQSSAKRMQTLINDLLTYSRILTKAQPFIPVSLNQILRQVCSDLELRVEQSGGKIVVGSLPSIQADATQMHQLFLNLVGNGLKFHRKDVLPVVEISAEILDEIRLEKVEKVCRIFVRDNGIGFDEKYRERIFTVFQRLHGRHEYEGTGIGLAVCRKIVERHRGAICAKSTLGEGSTFVVSLPVEHPKGE